MHISSYLQTDIQKDNLKKEIKMVTYRSRRIKVEGKGGKQDISEHIT